MEQAQLDDRTKSAIRDACREVAESQLGRGRGALVEVHTTDRLSDELFKLAIEAVECSYVEDPATVVRAARYLAETHALGMMGSTGTRWFLEMMRCLLELASPNGCPTERHAAFFRDIEHGIAVSREGWKENA